MAGKKETNDKPIDSYGFNHGDKLGYFLTYLLIAGSGFLNFSNHYFLGTTFTLTFILFLVEKQLFEKSVFHFIIFLVILVLAQTVKFEKFFLYTNGVLFVKFLFPYFAIKLIGRNYPRYYVNIIYVFTIISFIFYLPSLISPKIYHILLAIPDMPGSEYDNIITLYQVSPWYGEMIRNYGPFREPGVFAGFLIIAILFNIIENKNILNKKNIIFITGIVTTLSTAGFIALVVIIISHQIVFHKRYQYKYMLIPIILSLMFSVVAYYQFEFLHGKIERTFKRAILIASSELEKDGPRGRFLSAKLDIVEILKHPVFGKGRHMLMMYDDIDESYLVRRGGLAGTPYGRTNGITNFAIQYGLIGFFYYFILMVRSFKAYNYAHGINKVFSYCMLGSILVIGFSQCIFQMPIMVALIFMHVLFPQPYSNQTKLKPYFNKQTQMLTLYTGSSDNGKGTAKT